MGKDKKPYSLILLKREKMEKKENEEKVGTTKK